jgi:hypothetical protein
MNKLVPFLLSASLCFAGGIPTRNIYGDYIEARTADVYTGPCFANSEAGLIGNLAVFGWKVAKGSWQGVDLDGLSVVAAIKAKNTLGNVYETAYPVKAILIVDEKATPEQRLALRSFARHMGGDLLQDIVQVDYRPISLEYENNDMHSMKATLTAGTLAKIQTRAMNEGDHICRNEETWYQPLTKTTHAMPAYSVANTFQGQGLGTTWRSPDKRSSFIGNFAVPSE